MRRPNVPPDLQAALEQYWIDHPTMTKEQRMDQLLKLVQWKGRKRWSRYEFQQRKHELLPMPFAGDCQVCGSIAMHRHHIVPLSRGGPNTEANLIVLCLSDHERLHPWMQQNRNRFKAGRLHRWGGGWGQPTGDQPSGGDGGGRVDP